MTTTDETPANNFGDNTVIGAQGQNITIHGGIQLGHNPTEQDLYDEGVSNLIHGAAEQARARIWQAIARGHQTNEVLFHWLLAMLSGRSVRDFSFQEIGQLRQMRPQYTAVTGDRWVPGVRVLSQLLDRAIPSLAVDDPCASPADLPALKEELAALDQDQRDLVRPHLELFLTGQEQDALWLEVVQRAKGQQFEGDRLDRVWMYYHSAPRPVTLPLPQDPEVTDADHRRMYASGALFTAAFGFFGVALLWHGAFGGFLAFVLAIAGCLIAAEADRKRRFLSLRHLAERFGQCIPKPAGDKALADRVQTLFEKYISKYEPNKERCEYFKTAFAERLEAERSEVIGVCCRDAISADELRWLIRYRSCQLLHLWRREGLLDRNRMNRPHSPLMIVRGAGLALLALCGIGAIGALRAFPLADAGGTAAVLISATLAWRCWLPVTLERERSRVQSERRRQRQADIDEAFTQWSQRLQRKPSSDEMGTWLAADRVILLDMALDHFHLPRSRLIAHALLEERMPWARAGHSDDGPTMYAKYQILVFLLVNDGVRMVKATLDFTTASLVIRERRDFRYDSIVAVRVIRTAGDQETFELQLSSGDPITFVIRGAGPVAAASGHGTDMPGEDSPLSEASTASTLHLLEGIAAEGRNWLNERTWN